MALIVYTTDEVMELGLEMTGKNKAWQRRNKRTTNLSDFKISFGVLPVVAAEIWVELQSTDLKDAQIDTTIRKRNCNLANFLWAFHFLMRYQVGGEMKKKMGFGSENTVAKWIWYFLRRIRALKTKKVSVIECAF